MIIWLTGLSGAGKSTIANALLGKLRTTNRNVVLLDGDVIRALYGNSLCYREQDRIVQVNRLQALAGFLASEGNIVIVTVLYSSPKLLAWNRKNLPSYFEIYVDASIELVKKRDVKGIYAKFDAGEMSDVVGLDVPWYAPEKPDLHIVVDKLESPQQAVGQILAACPKLLEPNSVSEPT